MIPRSAITHWNKQVPWEDIANVEQDLIITRALTDIFSDEFLASELAFRGGTALHKLYLLNAGVEVAAFPGLVYLADAAVE